MEKFNETIKTLPTELFSVLSKVADREKKKTQEIRLRVNKPVMLIQCSKAFFVSLNGELTLRPNQQSVLVRRDTFDRAYKKLCEYSVHSNMNTLTSGFLTVRGGNRVGVCSTAVYKNNAVYSVKSVTSLNIRIAREFKGTSLPLLNSIYKQNLPSVILAGKPASGKTTILRDIAYQLSTGYNDAYRKIVIVDERSEIANMGTDFSQNDVGLNTDVLNGFSKSDGIEIAVRTLSPDVIICDEIGGGGEVEAIRHGFSSGVNFIVSIHVASEKDIYQKPQMRSLLLTEQFQYIVLLRNNFNGFEIYNANEVLNEINGTPANRAMYHFHRPK